MKNKFKEKYIKDNRTEDEKMLDIIHKNYSDMRMNRLMDQQNSKIKVAAIEKKNNRRTAIIMGIIFISVCIFMFIFSQSQVDSCVAAGHDRDWCIING